MERRNFIKVLAAVPFFGAALARKCESKEYKSSSFPAAFYSCCIFEIGQYKILDFPVDQLKIYEQVEDVADISEIDLNENRYYNPKWNVNGSWNKAQSRVGLISHLAGTNHKFDKSSLNTLSTDQLQKLHDDDHNKKRRTTTRRRWFR
jgi:hypothetical protein